MKKIAIGATCLVAMVVAGCQSTPPDFSSDLSMKDPKWGSAQCQRARAKAADYAANEKKTMSVGAGMIFGIYGVGIAMAGKQNQKKQRTIVARDVHLACSSQPLPRELQVDFANR